MILRTDLDLWLEEAYQYGNFTDYCKNGLQVEGKDEIRSLAFAVSFNRLLLDRLIADKIDAVIVHHGFFGQNFLDITGPLKSKLADLLHHGNSLFGIHLPMDAHPEFGNNASLLNMIGATPSQAHDVGFLADNDHGHDLDSILNLYADALGTDTGRRIPSPHQLGTYIPATVRGLDVWPYGPPVPRRILCISGGASASLEDAIRLGADTFITGEIREYSPAIAAEHHINYICLGHYFSEKSGILALRDRIGDLFPVETSFIDIPNLL